VYVDAKTNGSRRSPRVVESARCGEAFVDDAPPASNR
jgi:hypothetical protein